MHTNFVFFVFFCFVFCLEMCKLEKRFSSDPDVKGLYIKLASINIIDVISNEYEIKCKDKLSSFWFIIEVQVSVLGFMCYISNSPQHAALRGAARLGQHGGRCRPWD